jgi:RNA polymerase sigma-B factor
MSSQNRRLRERNARVERYLELVDPIAGHYAARSPESREDLRQVGLLGLIRAAELFRADAAVPFPVFARAHVRGTILHYLRDQAPLLRLPRRRQEFELQRRRAEQQLLQQLGRQPESEELRLACGLNPQQWQQLENLPPLPQRVCFEDTDWQQLSHEEEACTQRDSAVLHALKRLNGRQRQVVRDVVLAGQSLREVARRRHTSTTTAHRLLHQGLAELRRQLNPPSAAPAC